MAKELPIIILVEVLVMSGSIDRIGFRIRTRIKQQYPNPYTLHHYRCDGGVKSCLQPYGDPFSFAMAGTAAGPFS